MKTFDMDRLRDVILGLTEGGARTVSNALLFQTCGRTDEPGKRRLLRQLQDMVNRGELVRVGRGEMRYEPKAASARHSKVYQRIWRAIRAKQPGFSCSDLAVVASAGANHVQSYVRWLVEEGYLRRHGKDGNTVLYVATGTARERREIPYPPLGIKDPWEGERNSACHLVRLLMERDPADQKAKIVQHCRAILDRFAPQHIINTQVEPGSKEDAC